MSLHCIAGLGPSSHATVPSLPRRAWGRARPALLHTEQGAAGLAVAGVRAGRGDWELPSRWGDSRLSLTQAG